jgi:hypothetical protein
MWWLAPRVDVDLNIVVSAGRSSVADGGHHRRREHRRLVHAVGGHGDDAAMVQDNSTSLLNW